jgi:hypothetical protein
MHHIAVLFDPDPDLSHFSKMKTMDMSFENLSKLKHRVAVLWIRIRTDFGQLDPDTYPKAQKGPTKIWKK